VAGTPARTVKLFLCGDVMTGRGIDQILPHAGAPVLYERYVKDARDYVELAERVNGEIVRPAGYGYVWGDALSELARETPDARIVNLETAITVRDEPADKEVLYRMHPGNVPCLTAAGVDCCALANNHVLDWGEHGLEETLRSLHGARLRCAGAGRDLDEAAAPAAIPVPGGGRVLLFSFGCESSGIPRAWGAGPNRPGVWLLKGIGPHVVDELAARVRAEKRPGDLVVASVHWGPNWGYDVPDAHLRFAHALVERAGVDVVHGHSSHHPLGVEVHEGRLILYGAGDLVNDYEGIGGHAEYRGELSSMYFATLDSARGRLLDLHMVPMRMRRLALRRAGDADARWLCAVLDRESQAFGCRVLLEDGGRLRLSW
jgi:poly-gamma-glutamate capsule biosynthesis protein CapA/YwtB (metallophosphatase superfamily)